MWNYIELLIRLLKAFINSVLIKLTNCYLHKLLQIPAISLPPSENEGLNLFKHNIVAIMRLRSSGMGGCKSRNPIFPVTNRSENITQREPLTLALFFFLRKRTNLFSASFSLRWVLLFFFFLRLTGSISHFHIDWSDGGVEGPVTTFSYCCLFFSSKEQRKERHFRKDTRWRARLPIFRRSENLIRKITRPEWWKLFLEHAPRHDME